MRNAKKAACLAKPLDEVTYDQVIVRVSGIYRGKGRIWGCERAYEPTSHPHIRGPTPEIAKEPIVIIERRGEEKVALIAELELSSLMEIAYLLRLPKNAERLLSALRRALRNETPP